MLLEEIKGFYYEIFLLVGSCTMLSWQLIEEVLITVYQHVNIMAQFVWLPIAMQLIKSMFKQCRDSPIMLTAWQTPVSIQA